MHLILKNNSADTFTYVSGTVVVPSQGSIDVNSIYWFDLLRDLAFFSDLRLNNITVNDGVTEYAYPASEVYIQRLIDSVNIGINTGTANTLNGTPVNSIDLKNYANLYVQISGTFIATCSFEGSINNSLWEAVNAQTISNTSSSAVQSTSSTGIYKVPILFRYFRLRISAYTSGTVTADVLCTNDLVDDLGKRTADSTLSATLFTIVGGTDSTHIGNVGDRLKADSNISQIGGSNIALGPNTSANSLPVSIASDQIVNAAIIRANKFLQSGEVTITNRAETDLSGTNYTVPAGKTYALMSFLATTDSAPASYYFRLKKQTGGTGAFVTQFKIGLEIGGQGQSTVPLTFPNAVTLGSAGDVFKITVESTIVKGIIWTAHIGIES